MRTITRKLKARVQAEDTAACLTHSTGLVVQGQTVSDFEVKDPEAWTSVVLSLPERIFKFALVNCIAFSLEMSIVISIALRQFTRMNLLITPNTETTENTERMSTAK